MDELDFKDQRYEYLAAAMFRISAVFLTVPLSRESQIRIKHLSDCTGDLDAHVDSLPEGEMKAFAENVLRYLNGGEEMPPSISDKLRGSLHVLRADLAVISEARRAQFLEEAERVFEKGRILSKTTDTKIFVRERIAEGEYTANLAMLFVDEFAASPRLHDFARKVVVGLNLLDSIKDANDDHRKGESAIKPSAELYFSLAKHCVRYSASAFFMHNRKVDFLSAALQASPLRRPYQKLGQSNL